MTDAPHEPLKPEELKNIKLLTKEEIDALLEEGRRQKEAAQRFYRQSFRPR